MSDTRRAAERVQALNGVRQEETAEEVAPPTREERIASRWHTFTAAELLADPPRKEFLWEGRIPCGDVAVLAGEGSSGKSALLTGLAVHRALGRFFLGRPVRHGSTVIVTTEDRIDDFRRKLAAWRDYMGLDFDADLIAQHVNLVDLVGFDFKLVRGDHGAYTVAPDVGAFLAVLDERAPDADLVVLETASRLGAGDESNAALAELVTAAERIAEGASSKPAVLVSHHVSQAAGRAKDGGMYAVRGGTALVNNARSILTLSGFSAEKGKDLLPGEEVTPALAKQLLEFAVPKINSAKRQDPVILRHIGTPWGLVLGVHQGEDGRLDAGEVQAARRAAMGESLRALADRCSSLGNPLTESKLAAGLYKDIPGLSKNRIPTAVMDAIADGLLRRGPPARGGNGCLLPATSTINSTVPPSRP